MRGPQKSMVILSILLIILSACGPQGTPTGTGNSKPVRGGVWTDDLYEEPDSLIPYGSVETFANILDETLYAPLFLGDARGEITAGIAAEVPTATNGGISTDLKTWTFKLRPNLQWSDGQPLNADDVDFSWRLWTNSQFGAGSTAGIDMISSAVVSSDKLSITFHLKQPYAPFLSAWVDGLYAPLPKHHFAGMPADSVLKSPDNLHPSVTSGPFKMSESMPGDHYIVVRNPNYYRAAEGLPYLDKIVFRIVANQNTILSDFQAGTIDSSWFLDVTKAETYKQLENYRSVTSPVSSNYEHITFNFKNPILGSDVKVRQAIAMSINYSDLIATARHGLATPLCTPHTQAFNPGYQADAPCPTFDLHAANTLLDQDGWIKGPDGYRSKGSQQLAFTYSSTANNPWRAADEEIIQAELKTVGIKIDIQNYPASTFFGPFLKGGKHDLAEYESQPSYDPDERTYVACDQFPPNGQNFSFYCNQQVDTLLAQQEQTLDAAKRQQIFNQLHQIYLTQFPFIILYAPSDLAVVRKGTHNYLPGPEGASETVGVWNWWCDNGKCL